MSRTFFPILHHGKSVALIIRSNHPAANLKFFTDEASPLQVGIHNKGSGITVAPHVYTTQPRTINQVHEVFFIISGKVRLTMYDHESGQKIKSVILNTGDVGIHMGEGHGLEFLSKTTIKSKRSHILG